MSQDLGGFVGHRSRAARAKFLQLLSAQEEDVLLRQEVSTPKGRVFSSFFFSLLKL